ncbi:hypothetical protein V9T40_011528 [Parthenolecanium corni]|uniref:NADP-dependent oxidoreductase domain-containing protein n=1 Tax=Parthenolecanium corni TaxID=536013 RepID=A0AAN9T5I7_9HEMI
MFTLPKSLDEPVISLLATLNDGRKFPVINFGTYQITGRSTILKVIDAALKAGYRGIDTAAVYRNEADIGHALKELLPKYNLRREDIYITSKLAPSDHGSEERVTKAVHSSLQNLDISYLDLYLIHWPAAQGISPADPSNSTIRSKTWETLSKLHDNGNGVLKSIGVSNYTAEHIKQLLETSSVIPAVNQVEFHPHWQQTEELHSICEEHKILLQAYSSLGGTSNKSLLKDPVVERIAKKTGLSPAQVLLRWALQRNYAIVPKSVTPERIENNADLNEALSDEEMSELNNIGLKKKYAWNPDVVR